MSLKFQKRVEDFICEHCHRAVEGNGFTNHCPHCLWSKHVDVNPGDRAATCGGLMKPTDVIHETGEYHLVHTCVKCGYTKKNKLSPADDFDMALTISKEKAEKFL
jgi:rubrerythrin